MCACLPVYLSVRAPALLPCVNCGMCAACVRACVGACVHASELVRWVCMSGVRSCAFASSTNTIAKVVRYLCVCVCVCVRAVAVLACARFNTLRSAL